MIDENVGESSMINVAIDSIKIGNVDILQDVHFCISETDSVAIVGRSGAGKTTLLKAIAGIQPIQKGHVFINGETNESWRKANDMSYLFQNPVVWNHLTAKKCIELSCQLRGVECTEEKVESALQSVGLQNKKNLYPHEMSVGMKARLSISAAFVSTPKLLLMDEPFSALDALRRQELNAVVQSFVKSSGTTSVWVTHDIVEALQYSDKIIVIDDKTCSLREIVETNDIPPIVDTGAMPQAALDARNKILGMLKDE